LLYNLTDVVGSDRVIRSQLQNRSIHVQSVFGVAGLLQVGGVVVDQVGVIWLQVQRMTMQLAGFFAQTLSSVQRGQARVRFGQRRVQLDRLL
jgi:hypothetical protein